jgi:hypothetical protein
MKDSFDKEINWNESEENFLDNLLKDGLDRDFSVTIPESFADMVSETVEKRKSIREALLKHLMMSLGLFGIMAFAVAFLFYFKMDEANVLVDFTVKFKYPIAFIISIITSIQLADSFLLSRQKDQL